jgi:CheY-like chemotaxis protein
MAGPLARAGEIAGPPGTDMSRRKSATGDKRRPKRALGRVLVVEDDPIQGMALEEALRDAGASEVVLCPSIACTMEALEQGPADAIVLDVHLADRDDGWALAELVDMLGPRRPRIVFSTGSPEEIPPEVAEMGPVFEKPYDPRQLAEAIASGAKPGLFARLRGAIS